MSTQLFYEDGTVETVWHPVADVQPQIVEAINATRDARIEGGFTFFHGGEAYPIQSRQSDRENIIGLSIAASGAIASGALPDDLEWLVPGQPFAFITADNQMVPLDAYGVISLYRQALGFKSATTFHARALKDQILACETEQETQEIDINAGWPGS